jgi:hypothetical protein
MFFMLSLCIICWKIVRKPIDDMSTRLFEKRLKNEDSTQSFFEFMLCMEYVMWTTFQRLPIGNICWIGKDIGGFVKVSFFWQKFILNVQTRWFFIDTVTRQTKRIQGFQFFFVFWPFGCKNIFFHFLAQFWTLIPSRISALKL